MLGVDILFDIARLAEMAVVRASRGKKLRAIEIPDKGEVDHDVREHVWNVEYARGVDAIDTIRLKYCYGVPLYTYSPIDAILFHA